MCCVARPSYPVSFSCSGRFSGGHGEKATPGPSPNTAVKGLFGEGTAGVARGRVARRRNFFLSFWYNGMAMKCEICHKNDAKTAIHVTVSGRDRELYVCKDCAEAEKSRRRQPSRRRFGHLPFTDDDDDSDILGGDDGKKQQKRHWTLAEDAEPCPDCGTTLEDFDRSGLLGCPYCYTAFKEYLSRNVRMRGTFGGKVPRRGKSNDDKGE